MSSRKRKKRRQVRKFRGAKYLESGAKGSVPWLESQSYGIGKVVVDSEGRLWIRIISSGYDNKHKLRQAVLTGVGPHDTELIQFRLTRPYITTEEDVIRKTSPYGRKKFMVWVREIKDTRVKVDLTDGS